MREYRIDSTNKTVTFEFDYDEEIISQIKACSYDSRWNPELKHWIVPVNSFTKSKILYLISSNSFVPARAVVEKGVSFSYEIEEERYSKLEALCKLQDFTYSPRKYQLEALSFAVEKKSLINGDDVGLGKTFESIMYTEVIFAFPCLVVVPSSVKMQWAQVWKQITKGRRSISVIESKETKKHKNNWDADVVIINYDIIGKKQGTGATVKFQELVKTKWKMGIFDEAHFLKEKKSQRAKAAKMITKRDMIIQLLTGTATMSRPVELWNLLILAKKDHLIAKDWMQFVTRYCGGYKGKFGWVTSGATNMLELNQKLRETCYLRREKRDVLSELPDVETVILRTPITNSRDIQRALTDFIKYIRETKGEEAADSAMEAEHLVALGTLRMLSIDGKLKAIEQFLKDWAVGGKKLIVFGIHSDQLKYLAEKFKSPLIAGGVSSAQKQIIKNNWIASDDTFLFGNIASMGTGVDGLQDVCSNMLITELPWRPSDLEQVIGRLDRSGQKVSPTVRYMLSDDTIDSQMWEMLEEKEAVVGAVNKGVDILKTDSGMKSVMKKILKKSKK